MQLPTLGTSQTLKVEASATMHHQLFSAQQFLVVGLKLLRGLQASAAVQHGSRSVGTWHGRVSVGCLAEKVISRVLKVLFSHHHASLRSG